MQAERESRTPEWVAQTLIPLMRDEARLSTMSELARGAGALDGTARLHELVREAIASR